MKKTKLKDKIHNSNYNYNIKYKETLPTKRKTRKPLLL